VDIREAAPPSKSLHFPRSHPALLPTQHKSRLISRSVKIVILLRFLRQASVRTVLSVVRRSPLSLTINNQSTINQFPANPIHILSPLNSQLFKKFVLISCLRALTLSSSISSPSHVPSLSALRSPVLPRCIFLCVIRIPSVSVPTTNAMARSFVCDAREN
jgi:hypothetical protein